MAYDITFDPQRKLVRVTATGSETMEVVLNAIRDLRNDPRFRRDYGILCDFRKQTLVGSPAELYRIGLVVKSFFVGQKLAFVRPDPRGQDAQREVIATAEPNVDAMVFSELEKAEKWLTGG